MSKIKSKFECIECGYKTSKWMGKCPQCNNWNSFQEIEVISSRSSNRSSLRTEIGRIRRLSEIDTEEGERISTGFSECDRVLGGGIVLGSLVLVSGEPGIGKSTLLLQIVGNLSEKGEVLYISGEESPSQIKIRAERLGIENDNVLIMGETKIIPIAERIREVKPKLVIIDSIQTMIDTNLNNSAGSTTQIKHCTGILMDLANTLNIPIVIVGHVTKDGDIAGPRHLEHMVDAVLLFEGDRKQQVRILRTEKNRFGSTDEVGIFEMKNKGLVEVKNPSEIFLTEENEVRAGSAIVVTMEGTRPILAEVQALVVPSTFNYPRRMAVGIDTNRVILLSAVLERKVGLPLSRYDIYVNVVGGLRITETSSDLAVVFAIASGLKEKTIGEKTVVIGEVGLTGEIRNITQIEQRLNEANKLGWINGIVPNQSFVVPKGFNPIKVKSIEEAFGKIF